MGWWKLECVCDALDLFADFEWANEVRAEFATGEFQLEVSSRKPHMVPDLALSQT